MSENQKANLQKGWVALQDYHVKKKEKQLATPVLAMVRLTDNLQRSLLTRLSQILSPYCISIVSECPNSLVKLKRPRFFYLISVDD